MGKGWQVLPFPYWTNLADATPPPATMQRTRSIRISTNCAPWFVGVILPMKHASTPFVHQNPPFLDERGGSDWLFGREGTRLRQAGFKPVVDKVTTQIYLLRSTSYIVRTNIKSPDVV